jgi:hypothetical protein
MVKKVTIDEITRKTVVQRADGRCECDIATHDHDSNQCDRKPKHIVFKEDAIRVSHPDSLMAVCPSCRSQIRYELGY